MTKQWSRTLELFQMEDVDSHVCWFTAPHVFPSLISISFFRRGNVTAQVFEYIHVTQQVLINKLQQTGHCHLEENKKNITSPTSVYHSTKTYTDRRIGGG